MDPAVGEVARVGGAPPAHWSAVLPASPWPGCERLARNGGGSDGWVAPSALASHGGGADHSRGGLRCDAWSS
jgi:hypothetical protein